MVWSLSFAPESREWYIGELSLGFVLKDGPSPTLKFGRIIRFVSRHQTVS